MTTVRVALRPMRPSEFDAYMAARDDEYVKTLTATVTVEVAKAKAKAKAKADRAPFLPNGLSTAGQRFYVAENAEGEAVGSVWLSLTDPRTGSADTAWLFDIEVHPASRRQGYATAILREVESVSLISGARSLALNVSGGNAAALALYESTGYTVASRQMVKGLGDDPK